MKHLLEEELIEHYYSKSETSRDDEAVERHLEDCAECTAKYAELRQDLDEIKLEAPARDDGYGERVWAAIAPSLAVYTPERRPWWSTGITKGLAYAAVGGLLVAGAFMAGRMWEQRQQPRIAIAKPATPEVKQHVVVVVLSDHLDRSERLLVELKHADAGSAEMVSPMRDEARSLLAANRICRQNAVQAGDPALETALDHLDRLLGELANQPGGLNNATIARLQEEMNEDGLLFEVRVLRSRIPNKQAEGKNGSGKGTI